MRQPEINLAEHSEREKNTKWKNKHGKVESVYMGESTLNREYCKVTELVTFFFSFGGGDVRFFFFRQSVRMKSSTRVRSP